MKILDIRGIAMARAAAFFCAQAGLAALVLALFAGLPEARAQSYAAGPFTALGVPADATAEDATKARTAALAAGQRDGLARVLKQLALAADYALVPEPDEAMASRLVAAFEILDERVSSNRYRATLNVRFKEDEVRALLRAAGVRFAEAMAPPGLVLPLLAGSDGPVLWEEPNPWLAAWRERPAETSLVPLATPLGDLADMSTLPAAAAASGDLRALSQIAQRYGAAEAIVAKATLRLDGASGAPAAEIELVRLRAGRLSSERVAVAGEPGESEAAFFAAAVKAVESRLAEEWKSAHLIEFGTENRLLAEVPLTGLADWVAVRTRLGAQSIVRRVSLLSLSTRRAEIRLDYLGELPQLQDTLQQAGLTLSGEGGAWRLALGAAGADTPAPPQP